MSAATGGRIWSIVLARLFLRMLSPLDWTLLRRRSKRNSARYASTSTVGIGKSIDSSMPQNNSPQRFANFVAHPALLPRRVGIPRSASLADVLPSLGSHRTRRTTALPGLDLAGSAFNVVPREACRCGAPLLIARSGAHWPSQLLAIQLLSKFGQFDATMSRYAEPEVIRTRQRWHQQ